MINFLKHRWHDLVTIAFFFTVLYFTNWSTAFGYTVIFLLGWIGGVIKTKQEKRY